MATLKIVVEVLVACQACTKWSWEFSTFLRVEHITDYWLQNRKQHGTEDDCYLVTSEAFQARGWLQLILNQHVD